MTYTSRHQAGPRVRLMPWFRNNGQRPDRRPGPPTVRNRRDRRAAGQVRNPLFVNNSPRSATRLYDDTTQRTDVLARAIRRIAELNR